MVRCAGLAGSLHPGPMEEITIVRFAAGYEMRMRPSLALKITVQKAVRRAPSPLDENRYRLLTTVPVQTRCKYSLWCRRCPKQPKTDQAGRANHGSGDIVKCCGWRFDQAAICLRSSRTPFLN